MGTRVMALGLALATVGATASAQDDNARRDRQPADEARANRDAHEPMPGLDRDAAISHALGMAIDGSGLWMAAQGEAAPRTAVGAREAADTGAGVRAAGENAAGLDQPRVGGRAAGRSLPGLDAGQALQQHALNAFQASHQLFQAVKADRDGAEAERGGAGDYFQSAWEYSRALEGLCMQPGAAGGTRGELRQPGNGAFAGQEARAIAAVERADAGAMTGRALAAADMTRVGLINHAVKETVEGVNLRRMLRHHAAHDAASQALLSHADQMVASGRQTIMALNAMDAPGAEAGRGAAAPRPNNSSTDATGGTTTRSLTEVRPAENDRSDALGAAAARDDQTAPRVPVDQLARLGRQVIDSIQALDGGEAPPAASRRESSPDRPATDRSKANSARRGDQPAPVRPPTDNGPTGNAARDGR